MRIVLIARCQPWLRAFELDVGVDQPSASGGIFRLAPLVVVLCDRGWHKTVVRALPSVGSFTAGPADVSAYLGPITRTSNIRPRKAA